MKYPAIRACLGLACCCAITACSTLRVHDTNRNSVPGVPFYVKTTEHKQVSGYSLTAYQVALSIAPLSAEEKKVPPTILGSILISDSIYRGVEMRALRQAVRDASVSGVVGGDSWDNVLQPLSSAFRSLEVAASKDLLAPGIPPDSKLTLVSNQLTSYAVVDTEHLYYINSRGPLFGGGSADFTLASDGTLTNAKGTFEEKILEQLPGILPVKEFLTKDLGLDPEKTPEPEMTNVLKAVGFEPSAADQLYSRGEPVYFRVSLEVEPQVAIFEFSKVHTASRPDLVVPLTSACIKSGACEVSVRQVGTKQKAEPEGKGYAISGRIILPEEKKE